MLYGPDGNPVRARRRHRGRRLRFAGLTVGERHVPDRTERRLPVSGPSLGPGPSECPGYIVQTLPGRAAEPELPPPLPIGPAGSDPAGPPRGYPPRGGLPGYPPRGVGNGPLGKLGLDETRSPAPGARGLGQSLFRGDSQCQ